VERQAHYLYWSRIDAVIWIGMVYIDNSSFANEAVLLYQDERLWLQAQKNRLI
jgi:hypothetical protein